MKALDPSISQSKCSTTMVDPSVKTSNQALDSIFNLFEQINKHSIFWQLFIDIQALYIYLQFLVISIWPCMPLWNENKGQNLKTIFSVFIWFKTTDDIDDYLIPACVLLCVDLLITIWILFIVFMNNIKHKLFKWAISPTKFILQFIH